MVLAPATGSDSWFNTSDDIDLALANAIANLNQIIAAIAAAAGIKQTAIIVLSLNISSINIETIVQAPEGADLTVFSSNFQSNL